MKLILAALTLSMVLLVSCKKEKEEPAPPPYIDPTLTTSPVTNITGNSAVSGGTLITDGGYHITTRGIAWTTVPNQIFGLCNQTADGAGMGTFTSTMTNLLPHTTYYVRAYAANGKGFYGFGKEISFTTP